jgi:hypothetical protein
MSRWIFGWAMLCWSVAGWAATYQFNSPAYTAVTPGGPYTTSMAITGSFTTAAPLPALMPSTQIGHGSFTFSSSAHIEKRVLGKCFLSGGIDGWQAKTQREVHHEN